MESPLTIASIASVAGVLGLFWQFSQAKADNRARVAALEAKVESLGDRVKDADNRFNRLERKIDRAIEMLAQMTNQPQQ